MVVVLITGVCGSGKTTVARSVAKKLSCPFVDADNFHPQGNIMKMREGTPLTDEDRQPWLLALNKVIERWTNRSESGVLACSALKEQYRQTIILGAEANCSAKDNQAKKLPFYCLVVLLQGSKDLIKERMEQRQEHFMPVNLLDSQLEAAEEPSNCDLYYAVSVSIDQTVEEITNEILRALKAKCGIRVSIQSTV
ncbi:probable gluconokinase [Acropora millepora]|uniref:probable gluconokinase n=1 Tax=Acropora millepora TaxID=45264 RepID=UPI001CF0D7C3|nr:probable gluconokinase [Acropora millepora]XP_044164247.1 probable gluconokinase [Acropora millepora]